MQKKPAPTFTKGQANPNDPDEQVFSDEEPPKEINPIIDIEANLNSLLAKAQSDYDSYTQND